MIMPPVFVGLETPINVREKKKDKANKLYFKKFKKEEGYIKLNKDLGYQT